jgi:hypothetical protein
VGPTTSTVNDPPVWRRRPRFGANASVLYVWRPDFSGYALGLDIPAHWGPFGFAVEYLYAKNTFEEGPSLQPAPLLTRQGLWAGFSLMLLRPCLELEGRYDWMDVANDPRRRFSAATVGLTSYFLGGLGRVQLAYSHQFHRWSDDVLMLVLTLAGSVTGR